MGDTVRERGRSKAPVFRLRVWSWSRIESGNEWPRVAQSVFFTRVFAFCEWNLGHVRGDVKIPHSQVVQAAARGQQPYILEHPFTGALDDSWLLGGCSLHRGHGID